MCSNKGRLCWKIAKLFYFCHLKKLVRPETFGAYYEYSGLSPGICPLSVKKRNKKLRKLDLFPSSGGKTNRDNVEGVKTSYGLNGPGVEFHWSEISPALLNRPWGQPSILYDGKRVHLPAVKRPARGVDWPPSVNRVSILTWSRTALFCLDAGRLARSQYPEGPETGHLDTSFSWFPWALEQMLGWFPILPSCHYMLHM